MFINNSIKKGIIVSVIASSTLFFAGCSNTKKPSKPFITVWSVDSSNKTITIPINPKYKGNYNYTVNWGDGSISKNVNKSITHTYAKDGKYTVKINGAFPAIYLNNDGQDLYMSDYVGNSDKLIEIKQWGDIKWKSFKHSFTGSSKLKITATDTPNLKNVKNMSYAFSYDNTNTFNNINKWDVSNVTNMSSMFASAKAFNQPLDKWDVSHVTDMSFMFDGTKAFNQPLNKWDVSHVTNMTEMFENSKAFNQPLNKWDVSNVTNMEGMFRFAKVFNQPLDKWDVSHVTDMSAMFEYTEVFNQPLNKWDVSNVTNMTEMFDGTKAFNQPLDKWDVSHVIKMSFMFSNAISFNQNISNWNVSNVIFYDHFADDGCPINGTSKMPKFKYKIDF